MNLYVWTDDRTDGPFTPDQVRTMLRAGTLTPSALASLDGKSDWRTLGELLADAQSTSRDASATGTIFARLVFLLAALWIGYLVVIFDVSVSVPGSGRVFNHQLAADRLVYLLTAIFLAASALFCLRRPS